MRPCPRCRAPLQNRDATCPHCGAAEPLPPLNSGRRVDTQSPTRRVATDAFDYVLNGEFGIFLLFLVVILVAAVGFAVAGRGGAVCAVLGASALWVALLPRGAREK